MKGNTERNIRGGKKIQNEIRDSLITLINQSNECGEDETFDCNNCKYNNEVNCLNAKCADHLIEHGVMLLPCKVGDILYCVDELPKVLKCKVHEIDIVDNAIVIRVGREGFFAKAYMSADIGKRLFLTREAAEKALKEKNNGT